jgi:hypothetical protein
LIHFHSAVQKIKFKLILKRKKNYCIEITLEFILQQICNSNKYFFYKKNTSDLKKFVTNSATKQKTNATLDFLKLHETFWMVAANLPTYFLISE